MHSIYKYSKNEISKILNGQIYNSTSVGIINPHNNIRRARGCDDRECDVWLLISYRVEKGTLLYFYQNMPTI